MIETFDIILLIEGKYFERSFLQIWELLTDLYNRKLHLPKESSVFINRELEMIIKRFSDKILPLRTELEKIIDYIKKKNKKLMEKF